LALCVLSYDMCALCSSSDMCIVFLSSVFVRHKK
jgi:hypothetical protein